MPAAALHPDPQALLSLLDVLDVECHQLAAAEAAGEADEEHRPVPQPRERVRGGHAEHAPAALMLENPKTLSRLYTLSPMLIYAR